MKKIYIALFVSTALLLRAQTICNPAGNLMLFTNYDGGTLTINVDQNIPNLKIGICSYEGVAIYLTGAFVSNVTAIRYAGYNGSNPHCGGAINTNFNGVPGTAVTTSVFAPPVTLSNPNGYSSIICGYSCSNNTNQGGCNTVDQIEAYFLSYFTGSSLYAHKVQYGCWTGTQSLSIGGNCCPPIPVYPGVVSSSQTICAGSAPSGFLSAASATAASGTISYQWESSTISSSAGFSGISGATGAAYTSGAISQTTYYRRAAATNGTNTVYSNVITVTVLPPVPVNITGPSGVCIGSSATLSASGGTSYAWSNNATTGSSVVITPTTNAVITITCFPVNGCSVTASKTVVVNAFPAVSAQAIDPSSCVGETNTLTVFSPGVVNFTWQPGNLIGTSVTITAVSTMVYTLTGVDQNNCTGTETVAVIVNPLPTITIVPEANPACSAKVTSLVANGALSYTWMPGASTSFSLSVTPTAQVVYTVTGFDSYCTNTATLSLGVLQNPTASISPDRGKMCVKETVLLTAGGGTAYAWQNAGMSSVTANTVIVTPTTTTSYSVVVTGTNGCTDKAVSTVTVLSCSGITDHNGNSAFNVYPNPNNGEFYISASALLDIELINNAGQLVKRFQLNEKNNYGVSVTDLAAGIYFVISGSGEQAIRQKIIVAK